jgi:hypothetical protein
MQKAPSQPANASIVLFTFCIFGLPLSTTETHGERYYRLRFKFFTRMPPRTQVNTTRDRRIKFFGNIASRKTLSSRAALTTTHILQLATDKNKRCKQKVYAEGGFVHRRARGQQNLFVPQRKETPGNQPSHRSNMA